MTFLRLTMHNFGPFKDTHTVDLSPIEGKNIIVIGGMNGAGKTTILSAIRLVLLGKLSNKQISNSKSYHNTLQGFINNNTSSEQTWIELDFEMFQESKKKYRIRRSWNCISIKNVEEEFSFFSIETNPQGKVELKNLLVDAMNWYGNIENFFPPKISELFLFDGERIEEMADPRNTSTILSSAIEILFGEGLIKQLERDLKFLYKELLQEQANISSDINFKNSIIKFENTENEVLNKKNEISKNQEKITDLSIKESSTRENLRILGGEYFHKKEDFEHELKLINESLATLNNKMIQLMNLELPYNFQYSQCDSIIKNSENTISNETINTVEKHLKKRDKHIINRFKTESLPQNTIDILKQILLDTPLVFSKTPSYFNHQETIEAKRLLTLAPEIGIQYKAIILDYKKCNDKKQIICDKLSQLPAAEIAQPLIDQLNTINTLIEEINTNTSLLNLELNIIISSYNETKRQLIQYADDYKNNLEKSEELTRMQQRIKEVTTILSHFKKEIITNRVNNIRNTSLEMFNQLHRKSGFIKDIVIDPSTLELNLLNSMNQPLDISQLSAGERQIMATSLLWSIAKSSGQILPFVIDTPLGRLDSIHRENLVKYFFPFASHQVILLSTDEEIQAKDYHILKEYICHEYGIRYNNESASSYITTEYPFKMNKEVQ